MFARLTSCCEVSLQLFGHKLSYRAPVLWVVVGLQACLVPTDRSGQLQVEMELPANLFIKDSLQLRARLEDAGGKPISNAVIRYTSDDVGVVSVTEGGKLLAVGVGTATVTAVALGYEGAGRAQRSVRVRGLLEVDSIRNENAARQPGNAWFGDVIEIFGVGLAPESLFAVTVGGIQAEIREYVPDDPTERNRLGRLFVWVPPPAQLSSQLFIIGFNGGILAPDTLRIIQRDLYEFNDTLPAALGPIPIGFRNPALAFEPRFRQETEEAVDWYTFENTGERDRTIVVASQMVGAETFIPLVTDSIFWDIDARTFDLGSSAWAIGRSSYYCDRLLPTRFGEPEPFAEVPFPFSVVALADLPAGTYHVFVPFVAQGEPASYEVLIFPAYFSLTGLPRDSEEENDYCDVAGPLPQGGLTLTIDNPHDIDWFRFTVPAGGQALSVTAVTDGTANADVDLYLLGDFRPDSLVLLRAATNAGDAEALTQFVQAGNYFLVVFDFAGVPAAYQLTSSLTTSSGVTSAPTADVLARELELLRSKRELGRQTPPPAANGVLETIRTWRP